MQHYNLSTLLNVSLPAWSERPALHYPEAVVTYAELQARSNGFAGLLLEQGLSAGCVVGIASSKRPDTYALMLACLQLGIPYVNLDVTSPEERLERICVTCRPDLLFADHPAPLFSSLAARLGSIFIGPDRVLPEVFHIPEVVRLAVDGSTIAYIMYTSGSTGIPKGVAVTHQNLLHFIAWTKDFFGITSEDNFAQLSPLYFDNSVFDFYSTFFTGASLTPIPQDLLTQPKTLVDHVTAMNCTIWFSVPSLLVYLLNMKVLTGWELEAVRVFTFGGEGFPKTELRKLYDLYGHRARLVNVYGPTECTCICSNWEITEADFTDMTNLAPLGRLNPNFSCLIIGEDNHPVPDGQPGELHLLGPNVSAGYYNDPERSASAFTPCEHPPHLLKPCYKTGDLARLENDVLYFHGRKDNQIKHMGYRIELEEIEAALNSLPEIGQAAVVYHRIQAAYGKIVAYVAPDYPDKTLEPAQIKKQLESLLPSYMIPSKVIALDHLPRNANGKVDRVLLSNDRGQ
ncbi:D-alanine--poly(phosphoribitol) ligase subunit 1 [Desulfonatronum zhilinae]|nr:D-alanine--poly(phosphoribitol) ligase subunit 1 [Desulfonatronum zhilinae]